ncbi:MAG TPA: DUF4386 domain-containing protein [Chthoniobacterales bacterium]|nr:DUF4386 domain-containing protein [Chthoniobacterales bacterium]
MTAVEKTYITVREERKMSRTTIARLTGFTYLFYIATSIIGTSFFTRITKGDGISATLTDIAAHTPQMNMSFVLALLTVFEALIVAVALYALTRDQDANLALLALTCRVVEAVLNTVPAIALLALLSVALQASTATGSEASNLNLLGSFLLKLQGWSVIVSAPVFGVGSALYYFLFARGRSIPVPLAYFGVLSSALLVVAIPLEGMQLLKGAMTFYAWLPSLFFELIFAPWLIIKGIAARVSNHALRSEETPTIIAQ